MDQYQQFIHKSRYARWLPEQKRRETWAETVNRYVPRRFPGSDLYEESRRQSRQLIACDR